MNLIFENEKYNSSDLNVTTLSSNKISEDIWILGFGKGLKLISKLSKIKNQLKDVSEKIFVGLQTSADPIYIVKQIDSKNHGELVEVHSKSLNKNLLLERELLKPLLKGANIKRYSTPDYKNFVIFPYKIKGEKLLPLQPNEIIKYPRIMNYLNENKEDLLNRADVDKLGDKWYLYVYEKNLLQFHKPKILTQVLANKSSFTIDRDGIFYFVGGGNAGGYGVTFNQDIDPRYILGLLNSKLLDYYLKKIITRFRGGYFSYAKRFIEKLPIIIPDEKTYYEKIITNVGKILKLNKEKDISKIEDKVDDYVYKIYGLNEKEISIVEESLKN